MYAYMSEAETLRLQCDTATSFLTSVADPDPVGSGPFWSDPNVWDLFGRIRIRTFGTEAAKIDLLSTLFVLKSL
jgi:hypothetical protein